MATLYVPEGSWWLPGISLNLRQCSLALPQPHAHSLCLDFAVTSQSRPGQPWCEVQGSMDTKPLLQYDSDSNQVTASVPLGKKVNGTKAWRDLTGTLGGVGESAPRLQAKLCCQLEAERVTAASWDFSLDGQTALLLDAMDMNWTLVNPGATGIKEQWQKNQDLAEYFRKLTVGDCGHWLRDFLGHWENVLEQEPTGNGRKRIQLGTVKFQV
uniref:MHC class I-like antigen recognition-like domain-containing protein n=1 Tax=Sus scrofa TaxID=9823 RepID=A0A8D0QTW2_PIG